MPPVAADPKTRFWPKVDRRGPDDCWPWTGAVLRNGYGYFGVRRERCIVAHRFAYQDTYGPIPEGQDVDHACHNADATCPGGWSCQHRRCVNPAHLETAIRRVNLGRGRGGRPPSKAVCKRGHERTPGNVDRGRECSDCRRERQRIGKAA